MRDPKTKTINPYVEEFRHYKNNDSIMFECASEIKRAISKLAAELGLMYTKKGKRVPSRSKLMREICLFVLVHVDFFLSWRAQHYRLLAKEQE